jgi:hypothetical protein
MPVAAYASTQEPENILLAIHGRKLGRWWALVIGIALLGSGIFKTIAAIDTSPGTTARLIVFNGYLSNDTISV